MKKGDIVTINDSSYSLSVMNSGRLEHHAAEVQEGYWIVVALQCVLPAEHHMYCHEQYNNTIVQSQTSGKIVFVQQRFCRTPIREVTMAEVCAQFGEDVEVIK